MDPIRTPAVVLATRPLAEADLLVVLMTPGAGKVRAAARHARKSRRRFPGGLSGGALGEATVVPRTGGLWRLESFQTLRDLSLLGRDLTRLAYVAYACELTDALIHEPEPDPRLFAALAEAIERTLDPEPLTAAVLRRYELHLLERIGLLPSLQRCCVCGTPVSLSEGAQVPFDASRGGVLCPPHGVTAPAVVAEVLILVQALRCASDASAADDVLERAETEIRRAARDLTAGLLRSQLRRPLRSLQFFAQVGHAPRGAGSGPAEGDFPAD